MPTSAVIPEATNAANNQRWVLGLTSVSHYLGYAGSPWNMPQPSIRLEYIPVAAPGRPGPGGPPPMSSWPCSRRPTLRSIARPPPGQFETECLWLMVHSLRGLRVQDPAASPSALAALNLPLLPGSQPRRELCDNAAVP